MPTKTISIVIPVYNEEAVLRKNILEIFDFSEKNLANYDWQVIISDNNSNDRTGLIAKELVEISGRIKYFFLPEKGKGLGVIRAWQAHPAEINIFMDADLATDIEDLPKLVALIEEGHDIVIGSRHLRGSEVSRPFARKITSHVLAFLLRLYFGIEVHDTACGFKGVNQKVLNEIVPAIRNMSWTFDTELILLCQREGLKIKEITVAWKEYCLNGRKSRGSIWEIAKNYLGEFRRLKNSLKNK